MEKKQGSWHAILKTRRSNETPKRQQDVPLQSKTSAQFYSVKKQSQNMFFHPAVLVVYLWKYVYWTDLFDIAMCLKTLSVSHTISVKVEMACQIKSWTFKSISHTTAILSTALCLMFSDRNNTYCVNNPIEYHYGNCCTNKTQLNRVTEFILQFITEISFSSVLILSQLSILKIHRRRVFAWTHLF